MTDHAITAYGALPRVETNQSAAIQRAIDGAHRSGGGRVVVPGGESFTTGSLTLRSGVELHLEEGAALLGSPHREDYAEEHVAGEYGSGLSGFLLRAEDAEHVAVTGPGVIDQRGLAFADGYKTSGGPYALGWKPWRPRMIGLFGCRHVRFKNVTLTNAANWCLHLLGCDEVEIDRITIRNPLDGPNCDGIDPDHCTNVRIRDCDIEAGDDAIVIKATKEGCDRGFSGSHDIEVSGCRLRSTSAAIKIGTESQADFSNLTFRDCDILSSSRGLALQLRDGGHIRDVTFSDMRIETRLFHDAWWGKAEPIYVTAIPRHEGGAIGTIRRIRFEKIRARSENGVFLAAESPGEIDEIEFDGIDLTIDKWSRWRGGLHDLRPCRGGEHTGIVEHPTSAFYVRNADNVTLADVRVAWGEALPDYYRHALHTVGSEGVVTRRFQGESADPSRYAARA